MGNYSSDDLASLPATSADLTHVYDATDRTNVGTDDTNYVDQTGSAGYELHQYKDSITAANANVTWKGKSSLAPSSSKVQLQVYNVTGTAWEDVSGAGASNNVAAADTDFTLSGTIATADYLDTGVTTFRVYQATAGGETVMDSYSETNKNNSYTGTALFGMSFTGNGDKITKVVLYLTGSTGPTGTMTVQIQGHTGDWGVNGTPDGNVLATSDAVSETTLPVDPTYQLIEFPFSTPYTTTNGVHYFWVFVLSSTDDHVYIGLQGGSGTAAGNNASWDTDHWTIFGNAGWDVCFYVYGTP